MHGAEPGAEAEAEAEAEAPAQEGIRGAIGVDPEAGAGTEHLAGLGEGVGALVTGGEAGAEVEVEVPTDTGDQARTTTPR